MKSKDFESEVMLTPGQAADMLGVDPKTVARYAIAGKIPCTRTPGNHRRYKEADIIALRDRENLVEVEDAQ